jgi:hypothetical protein
VRRLRQVTGMTVQGNPRTMALSGSSTMKLKWGKINGWPDFVWRPFYRSLKDQQK